MNSLGRQWAVELYGCSPQLLDDMDFVRKAMIASAKIMGATVVGEVFHKFNPHGISGGVIIAESHLMMHAWPEYGYLSLDLYTCGSGVDPEVGFRFLKTVFEASSYDVTKIERGIKGIGGIPKDGEHK